MTQQAGVSPVNSSRGADDPDGLSFFTAGHPSDPAPTVFGVPVKDPLDRVFGDTPLLAGDELGTSDLTVTASSEQVMGDMTGQLTDRNSTSWQRAFILYGPPADTQVVDAPRTMLSRLRRKGGDGA